MVGHILIYQGESVYFLLKKTKKIIITKKKIVVAEGLELVSGDYEDCEEKNGPTANANLENGAFMGRGLRTKARPKYLDHYVEI